MALPPSTANWHWKNKDCTRWGKDWFEGELTTLSVPGDAEGESVSITEVVSVSGDIELGQRKSKLITIYEVKVELKWAGTASDGTEVQGSLTIPEVSHEITVDRASDYEYIWSLKTESSPAVDAIYALARTRLPTALETKFAEFPVALIATHGKDLTVSAQPSRATTPAPGAAATTTASSSTPAPSRSAAAGPQVSKRKEEVQTTNTTTVTISASFMAAADDLFSLLTDEKRIPSWTRNAAKSQAMPDTEYSLFGGNVKGMYILLDPPTEIVQTWALNSPIWPTDHTATLTTTFDQSSDSTTLTLSLAGVPVGLEDITRANLEGYYIQGIKSIGYVQLSFTPFPGPSRATFPSQRRLKNAASKSPYTAVAMAVIIFIAAFSIPYLSFSK